MVAAISAIQSFDLHQASHCRSAHAIRVFVFSPGSPLRMRMARESRLQHATVDTNSYSFSRTLLRLSYTLARQFGCFV